MGSDIMSRKYLLSWYPGRNCWRKTYRGKTHYLGCGVCKGKTDAAGYQTALDEWWIIKAREDGLTLGIKVVPLGHAAPVPTSLQDSTPDERATYFHSQADKAGISATSLIRAARDYLQRATTLDGSVSNGPAETTVGGLAGEYLDTKRTEVTAGEISPSTMDHYVQWLKPFLMQKPL